MSIVPRILHAVSITATSSAGLRVTTRNFTQRSPAEFHRGLCRFLVSGSSWTEVQCPLRAKADVTLGHHCSRTSAAFQSLVWSPDRRSNVGPSETSTAVWVQIRCVGAKCPRECCEPLVRHRPSTARSISAASRMLIGITSTPRDGATDCMTAN
jgi:hypothetical protein